MQGRCGQEFEAQNSGAWQAHDGRSRTEEVVELPSWEEQLLLSGIEDEEALGSRTK